MTDDEKVLLECLGAQYADPECAVRRLREGTMPAMRAEKVLAAFRAYATLIQSQERGILVEALERIRMSPDCPARIEAIASEYIAIRSSSPTQEG